MHKPINTNSKTPCTINTISQNQIDIVIRNSNNKYIYKRCQMQYLSARLIISNKMPNPIKSIIEYRCKCIDIKFGNITIARNLRVYIKFSPIGSS